MRDRLYYMVGSEHSPADPFGRSDLVIEIDGQARLDQYTRAGCSTWTGTVTASALDRLWAALEEAKFPEMPRHLVPAGSAIRDLNVGGPEGKSAYIAYHAAESLPGYAVAFLVLDTVIRQISQDTVKAVPASDEKIVDGISRAPLTNLTPGTAYLLACLPARRVAQGARRELLDRKVGDINPTLQIEFARATRVREDAMVAEVDQRLAKLASESGIALPPLPPVRELPAWLAALPGHVRPSLTTSPLQAAWAAGEIGWLVSVSVHELERLAYLRSAAPDDAALRKQAEDSAQDLKDSSSMLTDSLKATGLPLVISHAGNVAQMVSLTRNLTPNTAGGCREIGGLAGDLDRFLETKARELDAPPPPQASAPPSADEEALLARIVASPGDLRLRLELAALAERRNDARARLIRLQLGAGDDDTQEEHDLIRSHPEWAARLVELGARKIEFAGGFPDEITIDAEVLLTRGTELLKAAPLRRLHVRAAKGRIAEIVRSPLLATIEALDLDDQAVTDDDVIALGASPYAARLRQLDLRYNPLSATGIEALAASPHLKQLEMVNLDGNPADPVDRMEYYDETNQHAVPTEAGKALEAKYGKLRWLRRPPVS